MAETHPLQAAVSSLLILSSIIVLLSAYQVSAEVVPEIEFFGENVYLRKRKMKLAEAVVEELREISKGPKKLFVALMLKHAEEYLGYGAWGAAVYEANRAFEILKRLSKTTS